MELLLKYMLRLNKQIMDAVKDSCPSEVLFVQAAYPDDAHNPFTGLALWKTIIANYATVSQDRKDALRQELTAAVTLELRAAQDTAAFLNHINDLYTQ